MKRGSSAQISLTDQDITSAGEALSSTSLPSSPTPGSPVKHKARLEVAVSEGDQEDAPPNDLLSSFPTTDQMVSQAFLKDMMLALRASIQNSLASTLHSHKALIDDLGERVDHTETKMAEFSRAHNGLVDAHNQLEDDLQSLTAKVADLEDRNRRNNVKLRGIPESVSNAELTPFIQKMLATLLKPASERDLLIDRAHRLPKPKGVPDSAPRDVIMRVHFFNVKEDLMQFSRKHPQLPEPYQAVKVFADLSQFTIQARKRLQPVTLILRQHNIPYRWGFPTKLLVTRNGVQHVIYSVEDGAAVLKSLEIPIPQSLPQSRLSRNSKINEEWSTAGHTS